MAEVGNLQVNIGLNSSAFQQGITNINRQLNVAQAQFRNASSALSGFGNSTDQLRARADFLNRSVGLQQEKVDQLRQAYEASKTSTGENSRATQNLAVQYNNAQARLNNLQRDLDTTNDRIRVQESRWTQLGTRLNTIGTQMQNVGKKMQDVGKNLSAKITAPLVAIGTASAKMAMDFENSIAKVGTISNNAEVPIEDLRKGILKLSNDTGIASTEIANNVYDAISAGQSTGDAVNFVANSTKLAKAGFAEAGQSLDLLTTILNSYGLKSSEVNKVSDVLIQTQNKGKVTVAELSSSMGKVIPTANSLGVNLEQVASGYAIMTAKGIKAAETTTYMNSMFNEMGKSGTTASKVIKEATGKSFSELIASGKTVGDVLVSMNDYAKKNNKSLSDMFGSAEAGKAALILSTNSGKDFNNMLKTMGNSAGATDEAFKKVNDTAGNRLEKSLNKLKNASIKLGDSLTPIVEKISSGIQILADKFNNLSPAQQETIVKVGLLVAAIGPAIVTIGTLISSFGVITGAVGTASLAIAEAGGIIAFLSSPIGIAIGAITALIAVGVLLYKNWDTIKSKANELKTNISNIFNSIKKTISDIVNAITSFVVDKFDWLLDGIADIMDGMKRVFLGDLGGIKQIFTGSMNIISGVVLTAINGIKNLWSTGFNALDIITGGKLSSILSKVKDITTKVKEFFSNMFDFKIPKIKLPHFTVTGKLDLLSLPPKVPSLGVNWYDKGGIFDRPSIIGVGEKRPEFVGALDDLRYLIRDELNKTTNTMNTNSKVEVIVPVNLDGQQIAKIIAPYSDKIQGTNIKLAGRGVGV